MCHIAAAGNSPPPTGRPAPGRWQPSPVPATDGYPSSSISSVRDEPQAHVVPLTFHRVNRDPPRRLHWSLSRVPFAPTPNPAITHPNTAHLLLLRRKPIGLPVPLRIQTWRICRVVQAFDPSGAHVNSAESDSAVRCKHGEFDSSHAQISSLLVRRGIGRSRRAHHAAAGDGSWPGLAAQLLITPTLEQFGGGLASGCNTGTGLTT
jgi:hypothetical protein